MTETQDLPHVRHPSPAERAAKLHRLIREQGVEQTATYEYLLGRGRDLWETDEEFDEFLVGIAATRAEKG